MKVCGIDVGISHLAIAQIESTDGSSFLIHELRLVNVCDYTHNVVPKSECKLHHTSELADRMNHFQQEHGHLLDGCDLVAVERQPIQGLQAVQLFLYDRWREKAVLVSPNALHVATFGAKSGLDYEQRKERMEELSEQFCEECGVSWSERTKAMVRKHDVADALMIAKYALVERLPSKFSTFERREEGVRISEHFRGWPSGDKGEALRRWVEMGWGESECKKN